MNGLPQPIPIDPVTVLTMLTGRHVDEQVAAVIAAYMAIFLGACLGGAWSLSARERDRERDPAAMRSPANRLASIGYLFGVVLVAIFFTVPVAEWLQGKYQALEVRWTLFPLAAVIAGIGDRWPDVARWAIGLGKRAIEAWANARAPQQDQRNDGREE